MRQVVTLAVLAALLLVAPLREAAFGLLARGGEFAGAWFGNSIEESVEKQQERQREREIERRRATPRPTG